eukprot:TRINITY_DN47195_c0_g1_i2.p1 TRINITY_DN47195_c0_g1~~TRINITY_DN47195_c0_g1_i2.p1  ORF type:complete len:1807 (+),score=412.93 TRINITY_DN47195_c0_g1_i2:393-5813(+)
MVGGPMAACRCMPMAPSPSQLLKRLTNRGNDGASDKTLRDFMEVMLGGSTFDPLCRPLGSSKVGRSSEELSALPVLCLDELTSDKVREICSDRGWEEDGDGLMADLRPYLEDLITRRQGLRGAVDTLAAAADVDAKLPRVLVEATAKDLFVALLFAVPGRSRPRLAASYAALRAPVPVLFRGVGVAGGEVRTLPAFEILHELACVPAKSRTLLVSLGTHKVLGAGKTTLLGALALVPVAEEDLDVRPAGPVHEGSCDLLCADADRWVLDMHSSWQGVDDELRCAVLALTVTGGAVCLLHCGIADFHHKTGAVGKELQALLTSLSTATAPGAGADAGRCRGVVILLRDMSAETWAARKEAVEASLQPFNLVLGVIAVDDLRTFRSPARRAAAVERYRALVEEVLPNVAKAAPSGRASSSPEDLRQTYNFLLNGQLPLAAQGVAPPAAVDASQMVSGNRLNGEFLGILGKAYATGATASVLFPLTAVHRRLTQLRREELEGVGSSTTNSTGGTSSTTTPIASSDTLPGTGKTRLEQLRLEEDKARKRAAEMQRLEKDLAAVASSDALTFFRRVVASALPEERIAVLTELAMHLEAWKEPLVLPLLKRQRELLDKDEELRKARAAKGGGGGQATPSAVEEALHQELADVAEKFTELDFSMDSFWCELELLVQRQEKNGAGNGSAFTKERACWQWLLGNGQPFQLLQGRPLHMAGGFLRSVLEAIGNPHKGAAKGAADAAPRGIFVVSVIGAQSSAKSTLMNFLFGCGFAVRAGRCTRGLYASYFRPGGGRPDMLVLDSEGLLSLSSEGSAFDGQIALMCMTCSHLVLVNHKGELSRQLQDLLEVSLFAMRHLRLSRLQPRLAFVLRDQHDRSRSVHEDMLKQMRSHLEDAARTLGAPLEDLIRLDSTAVFLLPSAITVELRQGKEVFWTSELFAREVMQLRSEIFRWLDEDAAKKPTADGRGPLEFSSLAHWYDHASGAWDTLVQFGSQLLHYKTIHDIELRRELADVAKVVVRDALDGAGCPAGGDSADGTTKGFHARAREMVDSFVSRIHTSQSRLDLETTDMELSRALACLRDECVAKLEELFQERCADPKFSATAKEHAKQQLRTPIEWAFENHLYTWKLHLKKASDERAMHELWCHFTGLLNRHLANSGHRSCLSEDESRGLFDSEWAAYENSYLARLRSLTKDWQTLAHEVTLLFNHAVAKLQNEAGALALLKEIGPQQLALARDGRRASSLPSVVEQTDEEWEENYFHVGWWATVKAKGLALLQSEQASGKDGAGLRGVVIPRMRLIVQQALAQYGGDIRQRGALDESTAAEGLRHVTGVLLQDMEARLLTDSTVTLRRPQMLHALQLALRVACVEALVRIEGDKQETAMTDLLNQKALVEEHFLLIVQANKGDVERATNFATLYHRSLMNWLDHEVTQLAADVRSQVLQEMPDPQKSSERAFQRSFAARNWRDVLEYVIDMNAYLEKLYLTVFHQKKRAHVEQARMRLERRIIGTYQLLQDVSGRWARREAPPEGTKAPGAGAGDGGDGKQESAAVAQAVKDVVRGPAASAATARSVRELKDFIVAHAERIPKTADTAEAHRQLADRLPATADFQIVDARLFVEALQARVADFIEGPEIPNRLAERLERALLTQSLQAWSLIRGCSERCPLCGSKCDLVGEHSRHHCAHHLFPAFHGWMDRNTGLPSFNHCLSCASGEGTYECKDGVWRQLEDYLKEDHPNWLPFHVDVAAGQKDLQHLRAAWVHCREPLLEYFSPMTPHCPEDWIQAYQGEGTPLTKADLQGAKDTIRKLRAHTWQPADD